MNTIQQPISTSYVVTSFNSGKAIRGFNTTCRDKAKVISDQWKHDHPEDFTHLRTKYQF
jgi:hypothetical protein